ncbi:MAG: CehA/McbA family metallohydrolase [Bryobacterales bacterium]|nr:CehA/McbA family metallohydrolase [Bryobacterales bacterium]
MPTITTKRILAGGAGLSLLAAALLNIPEAGAGQGAVPHSRPGHEELSFWVNHHGLIEWNVEGEIGFGDLARMLMRRRSNALAMQALRDRFVFIKPDVETLRTPDLASAEIRDGRPRWVHVPESTMATEGRLLNFPVAVANLNPAPARVRLTLGDRAVETVVPASSSAGFVLAFRGLDAGTRRVPLKIECGGTEAASQAAVTTVQRARLRVRLRDEHGRSTAARVYLTAADGLSYAPEGTIHRFAPLPAEGFFHAEDGFEIDLPAGTTRIEAVRGFETRLASREVNLVPGRETEVELKLERWFDGPAEGWFSADAHIHANYTAPVPQVITPADVRLYAHAEDLHYANMMVANSSGAFLHDEALFEGRPHPLSTARHILYWNEEMRNAGAYGHMCFFNLKTLVRPLFTGFTGTADWEDYPPNHDQAAEVQRQGGAVTYAHPGYAPTLEGASARELPVDLALGQIDAMDVLSNNPEEVSTVLWYKLLNAGMRLAVSAGTDAFTNVADHYIPGGGRVYAWLPERKLTAEAWVAAYKRGASFATNGPMLFLDVDGRRPGDTVDLPAPGTVPVRVTVRSEVPVDRLELIVNGEVRPAREQQTIRLDRSAWIAARASGPRHRLTLNDTSAFAHTSPVYVTVGGRSIRSAEDARYWVQWIDGLMARTAQRGKFASEARKQEVLNLFAKARRVYEERATNSQP